MKIIHKTYWIFIVEIKSRMNNLASTTNHLNIVFVIFFIKVRFIKVSKEVFFPLYDSILLIDCFAFKRIIQSLKTFENVNYNLKY